jgi:RES domain-containing protein
MFKFKYAHALLADVREAKALKAGAERIKELEAELKTVIDDAIAEARHIVGLEKDVHALADGKPVTVDTRASAEQFLTDAEALGKTVKADVDAAKKAAE